MRRLNRRPMRLAAPISAAVRSGRRACCVEQLETRVLLAAAVGDVDDYKHGPLAKVGQSLGKAMNEFRAFVKAGKAADTFHPSASLLHTRGDQVAVEVFTTGDP